MGTTQRQRSDNAATSIWRSDNALLL